MSSAAIYAALAVGGGAAVALSFTGANAATTAKSQNPSTWVVDGKVDESRVPTRIGMSTDLIPSGEVFIDPHDFYPGLGAKISDTDAPVYDKREGGTVVGTFNIATGVITIDGKSSATDNSTVSGDGK